MTYQLSWFTTKMRVMSSKQMKAGVPTWFIVIKCRFYMHIILWMDLCVVSWKMIQRILKQHRKFYTTLLQEFLYLQYNFTAPFAVYGLLDHLQPLEIPRWMCWLLFSSNITFLSCSLKQIILLEFLDIF